MRKLKFNRRQFLNTKPDRLALSATEQQFIFFWE